MYKIFAKSFVWVASLCLLQSHVVYASAYDVLKLISERADQSQSDAVLVLHNGNLIGCYGKKHYLYPIETRSVTKTFVALAVGILMQEGKITSLDTPVYAYFPEWNQGLKKEITLRHLLNHTSGINPDEQVQQVYCFPDIVRMALAADLTACPGSEFHYNNVATNLLSGIVQKVAGVSLAVYLDQCLFKPLNITSVNWLCDHAGHNYGMSHLSMNANDLAKVGILLSMRGVWGGQKILADEWIEFMTKPSQQFNPFYGELCWLGYDSLDLYFDDALIEYYEKSGVSQRFICHLKKFQGLVLYLQSPVTYKTFYIQLARLLAPQMGGESEVYAFLQELESKGLPLGRWNAGNVIFFAMKGYQGQQLIVVPEHNLVGVRLSSTCGCTPSYGQDNFPDFEALMYRLSLEYQMLNPCLPHVGQ